MARGVERFRSGWRALPRRERRQTAGMVLVVLAVNLAGWAVFGLAIMPRHIHYRGLGVGIGVAVTAWTLGARHAFDADHIAAIDNATRKLLADGRRPLGAGFVFALGHSSVVLLVGGAIGLAARPVFRSVVAPQSGLAVAGGVAGTLFSASFLWLIAAMNLVVLTGILRVFRQLRRGDFAEADLEARLLSRGFMYRFLGRWTRSIRSVRHLFPVGVVFGIGFDTTTEVLLLAGTAAAATQGLPLYAVLALPLLFAGGLLVFDSLDGVFMTTAYGWAFARPVRKVFYNLTITGLSVAVAFLIGGIEFAGLLSSELHLHGWFADTVGTFDLNTAGYLVVALFAVVWATALAVWRLGRIEARWEAAAAAHAAAGEAR